ncbi:hypothetical protein ACXR0O_12710 [Verrucomicrobiota bacterium sgz303538]
MSLLARVLAFGICASAGYLAGNKLHKPSIPLPKVPEIAPISVEPVASNVITSSDISLVAEWEQFRGQNRGSADGFATLHAAIKDIPDSLRRRAFRAALIAEWATADAQGALAFLQKNDSGSTSQLIREWMRIDPDAAISHLLSGDEKMRGRLRELLGEIARLAPARLPEVVAALPKSTNRWDTTTQDAFTTLALKDPEAARLAALSVRGPMRGQALAGVAKAWAQQSGPEALAWAQTLPEGEERNGALKAVLIGWAKSDPMAALGKLDLVPPGGDEMYYASDVGAQVLREAAKRDWNKTMAWLHDNPGKLGRSSLDGLQDVLSKRLSSDPAGTLRFLSQSGVPALGMVFGNSVLNDGYSQRDAIWEWLDEQPASDFTRAARGSLLNAIAWKEPNVALKFLEKLSDSPESEELLEQGTRSLINGGSQMYRIEELLSKASPKIRPYLLETGFQYGFGFYDPSRGAALDPTRWLQRLDELPADRRVNAVSGLARGWASSDPQAAINWAMSLTDPAQREQAFGAAASAWAGSDPYESARWINSLPAGANRDTAARSLVGALSDSEPETAWTWALGIETPGQRMGALQIAYMGLRKKDPAIAKQLLQSANLSPAETQLLLKNSGQ